MASSDFGLLKEMFTRYRISILGRSLDIFFQLINIYIFRAPTTLKSEGEVTSLSGADKRKVRDNREKSKYFSNCTTFHIRGALSWHSYVIMYLLH